MGAREAGDPYPQVARDVGSRICLVSCLLSRDDRFVSVLLWRVGMCVIRVSVSSSWSGREVGPVNPGTCQ